MAIFIMAMTINPNAKKVHHDLSHHVSESLDVFAATKVKVQSLYATLGRYDYLAVFEADDQSIAFKVASAINGKGILETETWPVIPYEEFTRLIQ
ncbi:MAG: GYD domain-containing protein [candidate division Zixibacteria bacterium]|nr:GYD domain-containing protein [candidate division Zixibacteria bacterium]